MALPKTMKAVKNPKPGHAEVQEVPMLQVKEDYMLVKVNYVALNPTDWKHIDLPPISAAGSTIGCDYAGTIVELGPDVPSGKWNIGDSVAGVVNGANKCDLDEGAFAEYALVREGIQWKIPSALSPPEAATTGVALATVGLSLYQLLSLPWPGSVDAGCWLLVYGGSTATGSIAIQIAKLSGCKVVATASAKNQDFVKSLGANLAFDYNDLECAKKIREATDDKLFFALDCFGGETGTSMTAHSISSLGGQIATIIPGNEYPRKEDVRVSLLLAYKALGKPWDFFGPKPATVEDYEFGKIWMKLASRLLAEGKIKVHPPTVREEGLEGVLQGLDEMRKGQVSATKLVYKI